jgi:hypothetical protein
VSELYQHPPVPCPPAHPGPENQLFGTARVGKFLDKGFTLISIGNDLHHVLTQAGAYVADMENMGKEKGTSWKRRSTAWF